MKTLFNILTVVAFIITLLGIIIPSVVFKEIALIYVVVYWIVSYFITKFGANKKFKI
jgi:multisubunit Na+/H+ antiporter MnhF subunit